MKAEILAIGAELLLGVTVDTNSAYLAQQLTVSGFTLTRQSIVDDHTDDIVAALREARGRADLIVCTGGLGPTVDDKTREAVAQATGRPLEFRQELLDQIAARFAAMGRPMSESNHRQAYVPRGALALENPRGTAPAFIVEELRQTLVVLPGVPLEMQTLTEMSVLPYLRTRYAIREVIKLQTLHVAGMGESVIGERIADLMQASNPVIGTSAKHGRCELRLKATAESVEEADALLARSEQALRERLGQALVGSEPLSVQVGRWLVERGLSLALYENHPAAPVYHTLHGVPGGLGLAQVHGVFIEGNNPSVSRPSDDGAYLACASALRVRDQWQSDLGLGVYAGQPDASGFSQVNIALIAADAREDAVRRCDLNQPEGWEWAGNLALEVLHRYLQP